MERDEALKSYFSEWGTKAVTALWKGLDKDQRKERTAVLTYARKVKHYGKTTADQWLAERFGPEKAAKLLEKPVFKRQWIKYLDSWFSTYWQHT